MSARLVAARVLSRVARDGAFASSSLDAELARAGLAPRDAGLATEIVYGTLRQRQAIDALIDAKLKKGGKVDAFVRAALRISVYQLRYLDRTPAHAVINDAVSMVRSERGPRVGAFVNAVLRGIAREAETVSPKRTESVPPWLRALFEDALGAERAEALASPTTSPTLDLRVAEGVDIDALQHIGRARLFQGDVVGQAAGQRAVVEFHGDLRRGWGAGWPARKGTSRTGEVLACRFVGREMKSAKLSRSPSL